MIELDLSNNRIAGEIPSWIWGSQLVNLNLSFNLLTDLQKPYHISASLQLLDLQSNQLRGEMHLLVPPNIIAPDISFFILANNNFSGSIPTALCTSTSLEILDLSVNKLSGSIPSCILEGSVFLTVINLGQNNISGHIPDNFYHNSWNLMYLDLNNNTLEGKIPKSLERCTSLEFINVGNNIINDSFPCMLQWTLRVIVLRSNRFHGDVRCDKNWPYLQILDISSNNFSGSLESINFSSWRTMVLENGTQLGYDHSSSNFLHWSIYWIQVRLTMKGIEVELVKIWQDFTIVDFSCNNFRGNIPDAIGDLSSLHFLNLSHNTLSGSIPKSLGKLKELESLDLSENQLAGLIPVELAELTFLSFLNVSYNKLVGKIPNGRQLQTFSAYSFKGNAGLCGFNLNISCSDIDGNSDLSPPKDDNVEEKMEIEWEYVTAAAGYVVGLGSIVWILMFCRSFKERYFNKIEEVVEEIFDARDRRRRCARRVVRNRVRRQ